MFLPNITTVFTIQQSQQFNAAISVFSALARCLTIFVLLNVLKNLICGNTNQQNASRKKSSQRFQNVSASNAKRIEMTTTKSQPKKDKQSQKLAAAHAAAHASSPSAQQGSGNRSTIQYQPPAVRIHTVELEVSMQDDFSHAMQVRQRQTFGIDRDNALNHKPTKGFLLPRASSPSIIARKDAIQSGNESNNVLAKNETPTTTMQCVNIAKATAFPNSKTSYFVPAHVVEEEIDSLRQEIGELRSFFQQLIENNSGPSSNDQKKGEVKTTMDSGENFRTYDTAKNGRKHGRKDSSSRLVKKKSMSLMYNNN
tara:strand:- start:15 stop:947 length:933 start_codon:yes stop_codon:yes gene_type:complete